MSLKNIIFIGLGGSLEWLDFSLYGFFAPIFSKIFFSSLQSHWITLLATYSIFAVGFLARPIGAILFGYLGDKYGRILPLKITPLFITFFTAIIAFFPTYETTGNLSIGLLILTRIMQGILLGGEYAGNIVYLYETSPRWKYVCGSLASCTGSLGIILASGISALSYSVFNDSFLQNYGWRIAFLFSLPLGILIYVLRRNLPESPEFVFIAQVNPLIKIAKNYKKNLIVGLGVIYLHATSFYFVFIFLPVFLSQIRHFSESAALINNTGFLMLHLLLVPVFAWIVNGIGGVKSCKIIASLFLFFSLPIYYFLNYGNNNIVIGCLVLLSILTAINAAVIPGLIAEMTPNSIRYTILALVFNIGFGVFGGLTPTIALLLAKRGHAILTPGWYLMLAAGITFVSISIAGSTRKTGKNDEVRKI